MEIKEMRLSRLHNMEHFQFAGHVLAMCQEADIEKLEPVLIPLQKAFEE
ncbi:hypothetical protein [Prevotella koreensis]